MLRGSRAFSGKIHQPFLTQVVPPFTIGVWWTHLAVQVGTTKDQGLYNKLSVTVHPGALAPGTLQQYNTVLRMGSIAGADDTIASDFKLSKTSPSITTHTPEYMITGQHAQWVVNRVNCRQMAGL